MTDAIKPRTPFNLNGVGYPKADAEIIMSALIKRGIENARCATLKQAERMGATLIKGRKPLADITFNGPKGVVSFKVYSVQDFRGLEGLPVVPLKVPTVDTPAVKAPARSRKAPAVKAPAVNLDDMSGDDVKALLLALVAKLS